MSKLKVAWACKEILGISRQAYYKQCARDADQAEHEQTVLRYVKTERQFQPRIGARKLKYLMECNQIYLGRDKLFNLLRAHRLLEPCKRAYHKTTQSHHRFHRHPNLLKAGADKVTPTRPNHVWVTDITYLPTRSGEAYLSLVTDAYSRKIVGYHVHDNLRTDSVIKAFQHALRYKKGAGELIHHSDRGIQYCSLKYQQLHEKHGVKCSMTDGYDCYQNALAERINEILKNEFLLNKPNNLAEAKTMVEESVLIYNSRRPHLALKYKTPDEIHRAFQ